MRGRVLHSALVRVTTRVVVGLLALALPQVSLQDVKARDPDARVEVARVLDGQRAEALERLLMGAATGQAFGLGARVGRLNGQRGGEQESQHTCCIGSALGRQ